MLSKNRNIKTVMLDLPALQSIQTSVEKTNLRLVLMRKFGTAYISSNASFESNTKLTLNAYNCSPNLLILCKAPSAKYFVPVCYDWKSRNTVMQF